MDSPPHSLAKSFSVSEFPFHSVDVVVQQDDLYDPSSKSPNVMSQFHTLIQIFKILLIATQETNYQFHWLTGGKKAPLST